MNLLGARLTIHLQERGVISMTTAEQMNANRGITTGKNVVARSHAQHTTTHLQELMKVWMAPHAACHVSSAGRNTPWLPLLIGRTVRIDCTAYIATIMTCALTTADSLHGLYCMQNSTPEMAGAHLALELHREKGRQLGMRQRQMVH